MPIKRLRNIISSAGEMVTKTIESAAINHVKEVDKLHNSKILNNQAWGLKVTLNNFSGWKHEIPGHSIIQLQIENDFLDWPMKGHITINNPYEFIERAAMYKGGEPLYLFRSDARNEIKIELYPVFEGGEHEEKFIDEIWKIGFEAFIYDTDDPQETNIGSKTKKLYFHDKRYQLMLEKNIQWSTGTADENKKTEGKTISQLSNTDRNMKTGNALKSLLKAAGFEDSIDEDNWDEGHNSVFYTSPANYTVADDVEAILSGHISSKGDKCIFHYNRGINKWQLIPMHKFFEKAGKEKPGSLQIEHLFFEDTAGGANTPIEDDDGVKGSDDSEIETSGGTDPYKAPIFIDKKYTNIDIKMIEFNRIVTYDFIEMAGIDNSDTICDKPICWYNLQKKQFGIDFERNSIENIKEQFIKLYVDKLKHADDTNSGHPLLTLNDYKLKHYNIKPQFTYASPSDVDSIHRSAKGAASVMFAGIFLNQGIYMRLLGATHRIAGTFIGIDRLGSSTDSELDKKLCGQWFVLNVKHNIYYTKYVTDVIAVKVNAWENLKLIEEGV